VTFSGSYSRQQPSVQDPDADAVAALEDRQIEGLVVDVPIEPHSRRECR
jgi:hypothetical protein